MHNPRALVLRAPGINCDRETAHACRLAGFETDLLHINQLLKAPERLLDYHFLVIPGGFSYGDDLGAGTLLAKNLAIHLGRQLEQFIDEGRLVLGICNGFQALVRAGLLPGMRSWSLDALEISVSRLTNNASAQFECRWVTLSAQPGPCVFTRGIDHHIELPVAHGEGQFVLAEPALLSALQDHGQVALVYTINAWQISPSSATPHFSMLAPGSSQPVPYPDNPNGSVGDVAGICNAQGNVFGLMPHPERYVHALQHPQRQDIEGQGDGLLLFKNAFEYARNMAAIKRPITYTSSGVDIAAAGAAKELMKEAVRATHWPEGLAGMGAFAGGFNPCSFRPMRPPPLVTSPNGVGPKTLLAAQAGCFATIGYDLVNHSVNDLLTQGARPLFFMDYLAMGKLDPVIAATIVQSVAAACQEAGCALLGGETAEMPDVYLPGAFDLAGTIVGIIERDEIIGSGQDIATGDILLGLPSSGLHTNGYSLARRVLAPYALATIFPELGEPLVDALLRPHRCYLREIQALREHWDITIKGLAHITGGGFEGNISRILPTGLQAGIETGARSGPRIFLLLCRLRQGCRQEVYRALNMGVGMVLVVTPEVAVHARRVLSELLTVGHITEGEGVVLEGEAL